MNGYDLAANFRTARHSWRFTSIEADLYHELIAVANERRWPTEFQYSNQLLCATIGTSEKSLIAARNRLKQAGLLDFVSGQKRAPTCYRLNKGLPQVSKSASKNDSVSGSVSASICDSPLYKELKQKEKELEIKLHQAQAAAEAAEVAAQKKIEELALENESLKTQPPAVAAKPGRNQRKAAVQEPAAFIAFYEAYPRQEKRREALAAFLNLGQEDQDKALSRATDWFAQHPDLANPERYRYIPLPASWLNAKRWTDKPQPIAHVYGNQYTAQNGVAGHGFNRPAAVSQNAFGIASAQSLAIAGAVVMGGTDANFGLDL